MTTDEHKAYQKRVGAKLREIRYTSGSAKCRCNHELAEHYFTRLIPCSCCKCNEFVERIDNPKVGDGAALEKR